MFAGKVEIFTIRQKYYKMGIVSKSGAMASHFTGGRGEASVIKSIY
jgi:hypothetical protein